MNVPGDEKPAHRVMITKGFWIGETEVTVGAYKRFAAATGRQMPPEPDYSGRPLNPGWDDDAMPIVNIGWADGQAYALGPEGDYPPKPNGSMRRGPGVPRNGTAPSVRLHGI